MTLFFRTKIYCAASYLFVNQLGFKRFLMTKTFLKEHEIQLRQEEHVFINADNSCRCLLCSPPLQVCFHCPYKSISWQKNRSSRTVLFLVLSRNIIRKIRTLKPTLQTLMPRNIYSRSIMSIASVYVASLVCLALCCPRGQILCSCFHLWPLFQWVCHGWLNLVPSTHTV